MDRNVNVLELESVSKSFATPDGGRLDVLRDVSLSVPVGESLAIVGPSGSGKTTLLHVMGALDLADRGRVRIGGQDPATLDEAALARLRNRQVGFVFQLHHLLPQLTVMENVLVPALAKGNVDQETADRAMDLLQRVGLAERMTHRPAQLSGGERQRVAVVRALINRPAVILADEPTGALDRDNAARLVDLLVRLHEDHGTGLVMVTHATELARRMKRVLELRDATLTGRIEAA